MISAHSVRAYCQSDGALNYKSAKYRCNANAYEPIPTCVQRPAGQMYTNVLKLGGSAGIINYNIIG